MKHTETENNAAASAAGRALIDSALQRNPIVALVTGLVSPILGLFRRRATPPMAVRKVRLESYSSSPIAKSERRSPSRGSRPGVVKVRAYQRALPQGGVNHRTGGRSHG